MMRRYTAKSFRTSVASSLTPPDMELLENLCRDRNCTPSEVIRQLIRAAATPTSAAPKSPSDQTIRVVRN
jgi:hypothetical protein